MQSSIINHLMAIEQVLEQDLKAIRRMLYRYQQPELPLKAAESQPTRIQHKAKELSAAAQFRQAVNQVLKIHGALYTQELIPRVEEFYKEQDLKLSYARAYMRAFLSRERRYERLAKDNLGRYRLPVDDAEAAEAIQNQEIAEEENEAIAEQEKKEDKEE